MKHIIGKKHEPMEEERKTAVIASMNLLGPHGEYIGSVTLLLPLKISEGDTVEINFDVDTLRPGRLKISE